MIFVNCLRRCLIRQVPWRKCKHYALRFTPAKLGIIFTCSASAATDFVNEQSNAESVTSKSLIENASSATVTTVSKLLELSAATLMQHHEHYRKAIEDSLSLMDRIIMFISSESQQEELWTEMIAVRATIDACKQDLIDMQSFVENIEKLVIATREIALLAGSEHSCVMLNEVFNNVQQEILCEQSKTNNLETEYLKRQKQFIEHLGRNKEE